MAVYLRRPSNHGGRRLMERLRVPVARYNRRHFRMRCRVYTFLYLIHLVSLHSLDGSIR